MSAALQRLRNLLQIELLAHHQLVEERIRGGEGYRRLPRNIKNVVYRYM